METTKGQNDGEKSVHIGGSSETAENPRSDSRADHAGIPRCIDREILEKARADGFDVEAFLSWLPIWEDFIETLGQEIGKDGATHICTVALYAFANGQIAGLQALKDLIDKKGGN